MHTVSQNEILHKRIKNEKPRTANVCLACQHINVSLFINEVIYNLM